MVMTDARAGAIVSIDRKGNRTGVALSPHVARGSKVLSTEISVAGRAL
jgi:hypothetical protein